jgi:FkbM family methyltransferase
VLPLFYALARRSRVTLDIGASVGIFTLVAAHANADGQVVAFEPSAVFDRLVRNIAANGLTNVVPVRLAAGAAAGEAELYSGAAGDGSLSIGAMASSSLHRDHVADADGEVAVSRVRVVTVDSFVRERGLGRVDLVKIDTERTEPEVVDGMRQTISRDRPSIVCEVLDRERGRALERLLRPFDYRWYHLTWMGPLERDEIAPSPTHACQNYLFTTLDPVELVERTRAGIK